MLPTIADDEDSQSQRPYMQAFYKRSSSKPEAIIGTQQVVMRLNNSKELQHKILGHESDSQEPENIQTTSKSRRIKPESKTKEEPATTKVDLFALLDQVNQPSPTIKKESPLQKIGP